MDHFSLLLLFFLNNKGFVLLRTSWVTCERKSNQFKKQSGQGHQKQPWAAKQKRHNSDLKTAGPRVVRSLETFSFIPASFLPTTLGKLEDDKLRASHPTEFSTDKKLKVFQLETENVYRIIQTRSKQWHCSSLSFSWIFIWFWWLSAPPKMLHVLFHAFMLEAEVSVYWFWASLGGLFWCWLYPTLWLLYKKNMPNAAIRSQEGIRGTWNRTAHRILVHLLTPCLLSCLCGLSQDQQSPTAEASCHSSDPQIKRINDCSVQRWGFHAEFLTQYLQMDTKQDSALQHPSYVTLGKMLFTSASPVTSVK